jgi:hypothetical protein
MWIVAPLVCGLIFGAGLLISGMVQPTKVLGFLDIFGAWDPSLAVVMVAALAVAVPGFIALGGMAMLVPAVRQWLQPLAYQGVSGIAPPIYAVLAATAIGMILSCFRWLIVDQLHHWTGVPHPLWDIDRLHERLDGFNQLVEYHFRYHQFYANTLLAILVTYLPNRFLATSSLLGPGTDLAIVILCAGLFAGSRDALTKYYVRTSRLIGQVAKKDEEGDLMTNGCHHDEGAGATSKKQQQPKKEEKPQGQKLHQVNAGNAKSAKQK